MVTLTPTELQRMPELLGVSNDSNGNCFVYEINRARQKARVSAIAPDATEKIVSNI